MTKLNYIYKTNVYMYQVNDFDFMFPHKNSICSQHSSETTNSAKPGWTKAVDLLNSWSNWGLLHYHHIQGSVMINETERLGWALLQTASLPTLKCLVQSGKRSRNSIQQIINYSTLSDVWMVTLRRPNCISNHPLMHPKPHTTRQCI